jgi:hypothetical protein
VEWQTQRGPAVWVLLACVGVAPHSLGAHMDIFVLMFENDFGVSGVEGTYSSFKKAWDAIFETEAYKTSVCKKEDNNAIFLANEDGGDSSFWIEKHSLL